MDFSKETTEKILLNKIDTTTLSMMYPELNTSVVNEFAKLNANSNANEINAIINSYKNKASFAIDKLQKNNGNQKTINIFLPDIIKARLAINLLEQANFAVQAKVTSGVVRFNLWDGMLLQKLLFKKSFERKPVSVKSFKLVWPFITKKKILMPLVNKKGIYCFYSKELIKKLSSLIAQEVCVEIGAGDGTLTRFLKEAGVNCIATDNYSWENYIDYPELVEHLDAKEAIEKYRPKVVLCSWPPPGNSFEKFVFACDSVMLYIVIGTKNPSYSCNQQLYSTLKDFRLELNSDMSKLVLPQSVDNAVFLFRRI